MSVQLANKAAAGQSVLRSGEVASLSSSNGSNQSSASSSSSSTATKASSVDEYFKKRGYSFGAVIGSGSYAKVKMAEYCSSKTGERSAIAVKVINRRRAPKDFTSKFLPRELNLLGRISHENIVKIYEIYDTGSHVYVFMELAENGDLLDLIRKKGSLSNDLAKGFFYDTCLAVQYLHNKQIAHRDLKCENLLITRNQTIKLTDFGFARSCLDPIENQRMLSNTYCGSAAYAAPEVLQGVPYNPKYYDIWSLGCILYIMITGIMPFDDSDVKKMVKAQLVRNLRFPGRVDSLAKDLISSMLDPLVLNRPSINMVLKYPWLSLETKF